MKKVENLQKYVIVPNLAFYGGFEWDGSDVFLCDDHDTDEGYDFTVKQEIKGGVLITDVKRSFKRKNGKTVTEQSHQKIEIEEGQLLVYVEGTGYVIPEYNMCLIDKAIEQYELLR